MSFGPTGGPMKFLTMADWAGRVEKELFAQTYKNYGLATVRYPVLEVPAMVEPFENARGFSLRDLRANKPRLKTMTSGGKRHRQPQAAMGFVRMKGCTPDRIIP
jgi:hypothetical protein